MFWGASDILTNDRGLRAVDRRAKGKQWLSTEHGGNAVEPAPRMLDRVAGGDLGALAELYEQFGPSVYRLAYRVTGSIPDAQDIVQDVFIALPEAVATFRGEGSFGAWLRTCAARQSLLYLRKRRRRKEVDLEPDHFQSSTGKPLDRIELDGALSRLSESLRVVVTLREIEGFSHEDIARMLGITAAASRMRLMRAREQLREMVVPLDGGMN